MKHINLIIGIFLGMATGMSLGIAVDANADEAPVRLSKDSPSWCLDIQADVNGTSHAFVGCAETKDLCDVGRKMARDYASVVGVTSLSSCSKR